MTKDEMNLIRDLLVFNAIPLHRESFNKAIAILDAAIAAPEQEPVPTPQHKWVELEDAELAKPEPRIARTLSTQEIYKLWRERSTWNIPAFVRRCFKAAQS
jgi:hypothetical protein